MESTEIKKKKDECAPEEKLQRKINKDHKRLWKKYYTVAHEETELYLTTAC